MDLSFTVVAIEIKVYKPGVYFGDRITVVLDWLWDVMGKKTSRMTLRFF